MKKILLIIIASFLATLASAEQYQVMGYYPAEGAFIIVYGYYQCDGKFVLSHCRTNAVGNIFTTNTYLDINTCTIKPVHIQATPVVPSGI